MKSVLITGASKGLGRALFDHYLALGWVVYPLVRDPKVADKMAASAPNGRCFPIISDICDPNVETRVKEALSGSARLDLLINNAGIINHSDIDMVWSASRYKGFNDGMTWSAPTHKDEIVVTNDHLLQGWRSGDYYVFTVEIKESQSPIGRVGIHAEDRPEIRNIGFWIHPEYSGKGYATEAARAIVRFGSERLGATLFTASHATWNDASRRVLEKLGFAFVGEDDQGFIKGGVAVAEYQYELRFGL